MVFTDDRFLVICIPDTLTFYLNDEKSCKQEVKIYNVNNVDLRFKILCTAVDNYRVYPASGSIRKGCVLNVTIELRNHEFYRKSDIFKIDAYSKERGRLVGVKEIIARILPEKPLSEGDESTEENKENKESKENKFENANENLINGKPQSNAQPSTVNSGYPQNMVVISPGRFCFYVVLIFLFGIITGMILNAPQEIKFDL